MSNNRDKTIYALPKEIFTPGMKQAKVPENQVAAVLDALSRTGHYFHAMFKKELTESAQEKLYHAIIGDDRKMVKRILLARPDLLLAEPPKGLVIESRLTWQKFLITEKPMVLAAKLKQIEMLKLLNELDQTDDVVSQAKLDAIAAWNVYQLQKSAQDKDEIVIPADYADDAKALIDVFSIETFPHGTDQYGHGMLSVKTEAALATLFNKLLPENAVKLDNYVDVELLFLALCQACGNYFDMFSSLDQMNAFCIRAIGLVQSVLIPETAKVFCESLADVVTAIKNERKKKISEKAMSHQLKDDTSFYRSSRESIEGTGFNFFVGIDGLCVERRRRGGARPRGKDALDFLCRAKTSYLQNLCSISQNRNQLRV